MWHFGITALLNIMRDYGDQPRRVQRVTIAGDLPLGIDGKYSQVIKGDSAAYIPNLVAA